VNKKELRKELSEEECDITIKVSKDSREITLVMKNKDPFTVNTFLLELETYLHEVGLAADQKSMAGPAN
jgi:hypothetical protein